MRIGFESGKFVAYISFEQRGILKDAGWEWDAEIRKWATTFHSKVVALRAFCDDDADKAITDWENSQNNLLAASYAEDTTFPVPVPPGEALDPFQRAGVEFMHHRTNVLLADPPGLGKTVQVAALLNLYPGRSYLIVCPAHLTVHWVRTLRRWNVNGATFDRARSVIVRYKDAGGKTKTKSEHRWPDTDGVVVSWDDLKSYHNELRAKIWDVATLDEAHYALNPDTIRFAELYGRKRANKKKKLEQVAPVKFKKYIALSGTPIPSRPDQMYPLLKILDPDGLGNDWIAYTKRYCDAKHTHFGYDTSGNSNLEELQAIMRAKFMIRRPKSVLKLKPMTRQIVELPSDGLEKFLHIEQSMFETIRQNLLIAVNGEEEQEETSQVNIMGKLAEIIEERFGHLNDLPYEERAKLLKDNGLLPFEEFAKARLALAQAKTPMTAEHLEDLLRADEKVVCFVVHREMASKLREMFSGCAFVVGGISPKKKQDEVDRFQEDKKCRLLIGNIKAAGTGYTMTEATRGVLAEFTWLPLDIEQAELRIHRRGKIGTSHWDHLAVEGSMDAKFIQTYIDKKRVLEKMFDLRAEELDVAKALSYKF